MLYILIIYCSFIDTVDICIHQFKNIIQKSVYWIYKNYFEYLKNKNYLFRLYI